MEFATQIATGQYGKERKKPVSANSKSADLLLLGGLFWQTMAKNGIGK
jgi:hypothetical protein